jgi:hypothetical protein
VSQSGGAGGYGYDGAKGGAGASSTLTNAVSGSTTGGLYLTENSYGGGGGYSDTNQAGAGGNAVSTLGSSATPYTNSTASSVTVTLGANGGAGGTTSSGLAGATGGAASATGNATSTYTVNLDVYATSNNASPAAATAVANAVGSAVSVAPIFGYAQAESINGTTGGVANATGTSTTLGSTPGSAQAYALGASGSAIAQSTASSVGTGPEVIATATSPTTLSGVYSYTQASVAGANYGFAPGSSNGKNSYAYGESLPIASTVAYLVTKAGTPNTYAATAGGTTVIGTGVLGANGSGSSITAQTYSAQTSFIFNSSSNNDFTVGLLNMGSYGTSFNGLTFTIKENGSTVFTDSFTSLSAAQKFFTDNPLAPTGIQNLKGSIDLTLGYSLTAITGNGAGISFVLGDTVSAVPEPSTYLLYGVGLGGLLLMRRRLTQTLA